MTSRDLPRWVGALRRDDDLREALGLEWLDAAEQERRRQDWLETWSQIPYDDHFRAVCARRLERAVPLADGPERTRRIGRQRCRMTLVLDPEDADHIHVSLSEVMPAVLWARAEPTAAGLRGAMRTYLAGSRGEAVERSRVTRLIKHLPQSVDHALLRRFVETQELWLDDAPWGSWYDRDPWPELDTALGLVDLHAGFESALRQHGGRFPALSFRSLWSRGFLRFEQHPFGIWVFDLRYAPAGDAAAVTQVNELLDARFPLDLPVDLLAALLRESTFFRSSLDERMARGQWHPYNAAALCALEPGEATTTRALRQWLEEHADDAEIVGALSDIAAEYQHDALLFELAATTAHPGLRASLVERIRTIVTHPADDRAAETSP